MNPGIDLAWIIEKVVVPAASAVGGGLLVGRQARRSFHVAKLSEEESRAYGLVLADFKALRMNAAHSLQLYERAQEYPQIRLSDEEQKRTEALREGSRLAYERLRQTVALGPVELSPGALNVVQSFLAEHDNPNRSDGDGILYEEDYWTRQYLRDFVERRQVDLGAMSGPRWRLRRLGRRVRSRARRWYYTRKNERHARKWMKERGSK